MNPILYIAGKAAAERHRALVLKRATAVTCIVTLAAVSNAGGNGYQLLALDAASVANSIPQYTYQPSGSSVMQFDSGTTFSGTQDSTGTATSIFSDISESIDGVTSTANLTDSLATGNIHIFETDNKQYGLFAGGRTYAVMFDTVTFANASATSTTQTTVQFTFSLNGSSGFGTSDYGGAPGGTLNAYFGYDTTYQNLFNFPAGTASISFSGSGNSVSATPTWIGNPNALTDTESYTFTGQSSTIGVGMIVDASGNGMTYDYNYHLGIGTPTSTTFSSASGVLLSQPVPEIPGVAVLAVGFLPLLRRRRAS